jgi:hypothetical protein
MNDIIKRGPGRPRKQPEERMNTVIDKAEVYVSEFPKDMGQKTPTETLKDLAVTIAAPAPEPVAAAPDKPKLYTFKVLRHTNFAQPDFEVIDVDADGKWLPARAPTPLEYGPGTKVWAGAIINVNAARAKSFDQHSIGKRIDSYD